MDYFLKFRTPSQAHRSRIGTQGEHRNPPPSDPHLRVNRPSETWVRRVKSRKSSEHLKFAPSKSYERYPASPLSESGSSTSQKGCSLLKFAQALREDSQSPPSNASKLPDINTGRGWITSQAGPTAPDSNLSLLLDRLMELEETDGQYSPDMWTNCYNPEGAITMDIEQALKTPFTPGKLFLEPTGIDRSILTHIVHPWKHDVASDVDVLAAMREHSHGSYSKYLRWNCNELEDLHAGMKMARHAGNKTYTFPVVEVSGIQASRLLVPTPQVLRLSDYWYHASLLDAHNKALRWETEDDDDGSENSVSTQDTGRLIGLIRIKLEDLKADPGPESSEQSTEYRSPVEDICNTPCISSDGVGNKPTGPIYNMCSEHEEPFLEVTDLAKLHKAQHALLYEGMYSATELLDQFDKRQSVVDRLLDEELTLIDGQLDVTLGMLHLADKDVRKIRTRINRMNAADVEDPVWRERVIKRRLNHPEMPEFFTRSVNDLSTVQMTARELGKRFDNMGEVLEHVASEGLGLEVAVENSLLSTEVKRKRDEQQLTSHWDHSNEAQPLTTREPEDYIASYLLV